MLLKGDTYDPLAVHEVIPFANLITAVFEDTAIISVLVTPILPFAPVTVIVCEKNVSGKTSGNLVGLILTLIFLFLFS
jgi:hypothetical protein